MSRSARRRLASTTCTTALLAGLLAGLAPGAAHAAVTAVSPSSASNLARAVTVKVTSSSGHLQGLTYMQLSGMGDTYDAKNVTVTNAAPPASGSTVDGTFDLQDQADNVPSDETHNVYPAAPGAYTLSVCDGPCDSSPSKETTTFTVTGDDPTLTDSTPPSAQAGAGDVDLVLTGSNFARHLTVATSDTSTATVNNPVAKVLDANHLEVSVNVKSTAPPGPVAFTVTNTDGKSVTAAPFSIDAITITDVTPPSGANDQTALPITITSSDTSTATRYVRLDADPAVSEQQPITAPLTYTGSGSAWTGKLNLVGAAPGNYDVRVLDSLTSPTQSGTWTQKFVVTSAADPTITSLTPTTLAQGATRTLTLTGSHYTPGMSVTFTRAGAPSGSVTATRVHYVDTSHLTATITAASGAPTGAYDVAVSLPNGAGSGTCSGCFTVTTGPSVTSVTPTSLPQGASNRSATVAGSNLPVDPNAYSFGSGVAITAATGTSSSVDLTVSVSQYAPTGPRTLTVTDSTTGGSTAKSNALTVTAGPQVSGITPSSAGAGQTVQVTVSGGNFDAKAALRDGNGLTFSNESVSTDGKSITATLSVDAGASGGRRDVTVANPDGGTGTCGGCLTVDAPAGRPSIDNVDQPSKVAGTRVTLGGSGPASGTVILRYRNGTTAGAWVTLANPATDATGHWTYAFNPAYTTDLMAQTGSGTSTVQSAVVTLRVVVKVTIDAIRYLGRDARGTCVTRFLGGTFPYIPGAPVWIRNSAVSPTQPIGSGRVLQYGGSGRYDIRFGLTCGRSYRLFSLISGTGSDGRHYTDNGVGTDRSYVAGG